MPQANYCKSCAISHSITTRQSAKENLHIRSYVNTMVHNCSQSSLKENLYITDLMETTKLQAYLKYYRIYPLTDIMEAVKQKEMKLCLPTINSRLTLSFQKIRNCSQIPVQVCISVMLSSSIQEIDPKTTLICAVHSNLKSSQ
jgi:hypothetical protein